MTKYHFDEITTNHPMSIADINNPNVEQAAYVTPQKQKTPNPTNTKATEPTKSSSSPSKPNRVGKNNPFFGHRHREDSKMRQSQAQKARYAAMGNVKDSSSLRQIVREEIEKFLKNCDTPSK